MDPSAAPSGATTVVVADDEPHVVAYLETVLDLEGFVVVGTAGDADGAVQLVHRLHPDLILLDLRMPGGGLNAARLIGSLSPGTRIMVFSSEADEMDIVPLLRSGIDGYVLKGCSPQHLAGAIRSVVAGGSFMSPEVNRVALDELTTRLHREDQDGLRTARIRDRISDATANHGFSIVLQPVIDLVDGTTHAVEALTRFSGPSARTPDVWFAEAEQVGLRTSLELATASAALALLPALRPGLSMMINISPEAALSGRLAELLTGAPLDRIVLEITEHAPVADYQALNASLAPWRAHGARLAVDDAGGGYASFAHILNLSPDVIKLDISLTHDIHEDRQRRALARALVSFAREMDVAVIAEGIEMAAELEVVAELGTHYAQGYHLGMPRPLAEQPSLVDDITDVRVGGASGLAAERTPASWSAGAPREHR